MAPERVWWEEQPGMRYVLTRGVDRLIHLADEPARSHHDPHHQPKQRACQRHGSTPVPRDFLPDVPSPVRRGIRVFDQQCEAVTQPHRVEDPMHAVQRASRRIRCRHSRTCAHRRGLNNGAGESSDRRGRRPGPNSGLGEEGTGGSRTGQAWTESVRLGFFRHSEGRALTTPERRTDRFRRKVMRVAFGDGEVAAEVIGCGGAITQPRRPKRRRLIIAASRANAEVSRIPWLRMFLLVIAPQVPRLCDTQ